MDKLIYLDHAATTSVRKEVLDIMYPYFTEYYGNPSSVYALAGKSKSAVENARKQTAEALGAKEKEIYFTSSGTEADNWALINVFESSTNKSKHIITTQIEHHAILHTCKYLENRGAEITYLPVDEYGMISLEALKKSIRPETILISIMFANNEIGTIQPVKEIGKIARENNILFHTDAVQAIGHIPINVEELNIDMLSLSAHKFYGPKGTGVLYVRQGTKLLPFIHGGGQEKNKRAGTENTAGIVGLGAAIEMACSEISEENNRLIKLRNHFIQSIMENVPHVKLNGHPSQRLPNNINFSFEYIEGESILMFLDMEGICASSGSACTSGSLDPSHVLLATGLSHEMAHGSIRFTLGRETKEEDIDFVIEKIVPIIERLRNMSPLYEEIKNKIN